MADNTPKQRKKFDEILEDARKDRDGIKYDIKIVMGIIVIIGIVALMILDIIHNIWPKPTDSSRKLPQMLQKQNHDN